MLYIIGLGLNKDGITKEGMFIVQKCKRVYLEHYTVEMPYSPKAVEEFVGKKVILADREFIEGMNIVDEARKQHIALLVYGSPLTATTHIALLDEAKKSGVKCEVIFAASVFDAVAATGLQIYKFGKVASMPQWKKNFEPDSFITILKENKSIHAHTLILADIGLEYTHAMQQLEVAAFRHDMKSIGKVVVCQRLGLKDQHIWYGDFEEVKTIRGIQAPFCIIIPDKLHFVESEFLLNYQIE